MALRNQPYLPLYVKDFRNDEKLARCSASSHGVYILILCILHSEKEYGKILLRQNERQNSDNIKNFAAVFVRMMPFSIDEIETALIELYDMDVIQIDGDTLSQKRMVKDGYLSEIRASAGKKGSDTTNKRYKLAAAKDASKSSAKRAANSVNVNEDVNEDVNDIPKRKKTFEKPTLEQVSQYINEKGYDVDARKFFDYYESSNWHDAKGNAVKNWKQKVITWSGRGDGKSKKPTGIHSDEDYMTSTSGYQILT